jgi:hypothetical protein
MQNVKLHFNNIKTFVKTIWRQVTDHSIDEVLNKVLKNLILNQQCLWVVFYFPIPLLFFNSKIICNFESS